jgi:two-component system chemotaxis sensor kinase CheA
MNMQDKEMRNDLVVESREHLSEIEPDLLELEQKGDAIGQELINRIFRALHSIKDGFGFFGIEHITKLSHTMENVMAKIRDKALGELVNMIAGNAKAALVDFTLTLSFPQIIRVSVAVVMVSGVTTRGAVIPIF